MSKLLVSAVAIVGFLVLFNVGQSWKLKPETKSNHALLTGEYAILQNQTGGDVWLARDRNYSYNIATAMTNRDSEYLAQCGRDSIAFAVPAGTSVQVVNVSVSRLQLQILDGPLAGQQGWVEFEFARPRQPGDPN